MPFWVAHGEHPWKTCFRIRQYGFHLVTVEGIKGWMEAIEVCDADSQPIEGRTEAVIHLFDLSRGSRFMKFRTVEDAQRAFADAKDRWNPGDDTSAGIHQHRGYIETVICVSGQLPWFYAWDPDEVDGEYSRPMRTMDWHEERVRHGLISAAHRKPYNP